MMLIKFSILFIWTIKSNLKFNSIILCSKIDMNYVLFKDIIKYKNSHPG